MQELNKTIDINFKVGMPQWILAQPFWYPLLVICVAITGFSWLFGSISLILGVIISLVVSLFIILTGIENNGVSLFSLIKSYLYYQFSKKILLKKEINQVSQRVVNNCVITKDYIYNTAKINSLEYGDSTDKSQFDKDLESIINIASKDYLTYTIQTQLSEMKASDLDEYLEGMKKGLPIKLNGAYLALAQDLQDLVENHEFNQVNSQLTSSLPLDRNQNLNLQVKTLNNELQILQRRFVNSSISIKQELI
jgi:hypothetical protein